MNDAEWFAEHTAYLATPEWAFKRGQVLMRDDYQCRARLEGCRVVALQAHHLTYKHWRNEPLYDLIAVCVPCHEQITETDRAQRPHESRLPRSEDDFRPLAERLRAALAKAPATPRELAFELAISEEMVWRMIQRDRAIDIVPSPRTGPQLYGIIDPGLELPSVPMARRRGLSIDDATLSDQKGA